MRTRGYPMRDTPRFIFFETFHGTFLLALGLALGRVTETRPYGGIRGRLSVDHPAFYRAFVAIEICTNFDDLFVAGFVWYRVALVVDLL